MKRFARPYATVLLEEVAGAADDVAERLATELEAFAAHLRKTPELERLAKNPAVSPAEKEKVVEAIAKRADWSDLARRALLLLAKNYRLAQVGDVVEAYREGLDRKRGIVAAEVTSATPLDEPARERLAKALEARTGSTVRIEVEVDPSLLAGVVATIGSTVYDASLKGEIEKMHRLLTGSRTTGSRSTGTNDEAAPAA